MRLFEVHHFASEVLFDCFVHLCDFFLVVTSDFLMSVNMMVLTIVMAISMAMLLLMMTFMARILVSVVMVRRLIKLIVMHFNINSMRLVMVMFALMLTFMIDLFEQASVLQDIVDWGTWLSEDMSIGKMTLQSLNVMGLSTMVMAHVFFESSGIVLVDFTRFGLGGNNAFHYCGVLLEDVKSQFKHIVHLKLVAEALFLVVCVNIAQSLAT